MRGKLFYIAAIVAALWVNSTFAYEDTIADACNGDGGCISWMTRIIGCESGWDESAWHPNPAGGSDVGLLQIHDGTWGAIAYADGVSQIYWAADMYRAGLSYHWVCQ